MDRNDTILAVGLGSAVIGTVALAGGEAAGWAQAIGTVAAILAAAHIAGRQQRDAAETAKADRQSRARTLAYRLYPLVVDIENELTRVLGSCSIHNYGLAILDDIRKSLAIRNNVVAAGEAKKQMLFALAWRDNIYDDFHTLPPELASTMAELLYQVAAYDRVIGALLEHGSIHGVQVLFDIGEKQIDPALKDIKSLVAKAKPMLETLVKAKTDAH